MPNLKNYMSLAFRTRPVEEGRILSVSWKPDTLKPLTIPWDVRNSDPENQHGSWTILKGPAWYDVTAYARMMRMQAGCSTHIYAYHARPAVSGEVDGIDNVLSRREFAEWFVGPKETHTALDGTVTYSNTHIFGNWKSFLPEGELLRIAVQYWNASESGRLIGGSVYGFWGRPSDEIPV